MARPVAFISHATRPLEGAAPPHLAVALRDALYQRLGDRGWDPFLDRERLEGGMRWRQEILRGLGAARGGVVLFTDRIEDSKWVKAEATILCYHHALDPTNFPLVPVVFNQDVFKKTFSDALSPFEFNAVQHLRVEPGPGEGVAALADKVMRRFDTLPAGAARPCRWVDDRAHRWLPRLGPVALRELLADRGVPDADPPDPAVLARCLFACDAPDLGPACRVVCDAHPREEADLFARHMLHRVVPHQWVTAFAHAPPGRGVWELERGDADLAAAAVARLRYDWLVRRTVLEVSVSDPDDPEDPDPFGHVDRTIRRSLRLAPTDDPNAGVEPDEVVVCTLKWSTARPGVLRRLRRVYGRQYKFLVWPAGRPAGAAAAAGPRARLPLGAAEFAAATGFRRSLARILRSRPPVP